MHPPGGVDRFGGALGVLPVAKHHAVTAGLKLPRGSARQRPPGLRVGDADLDVGHHAADGGGPVLEVVLGPSLGRDRRGLRHAVADRDLAHVHPLDHSAHHLDRTRRAGHDPRPQRAQVTVRQFRVGEFGDEHRRDPIQRGAAFCLDGLQHRGGIELLGGQDHAGAVGGGGQVAHHHPEAVVVGDRYADPVVFGDGASFADEVAVVEDVVVAERRALREPRRSARVLDVDRVAGVELRRALAQALRADAGPTGDQLQTRSRCRRTRSARGPAGRRGPLRPSPGSRSSVSARRRSASCSPIAPARSEARAPGRPG